MAKKKIYELDTHSSIVDTDVVVISAGASGNAEKSTAAAVKSYVKTGLTTADVAASTDKNYVTDAEKAVISATSGTNTGDQDLSPYEQKSNKKTTITDSDTDYPTGKAVKTAVDAKQDTLVSGTNIKTVNGNSLLGSGNITIAGTGDVSGPASSTADHIPQFSDTTGKILKDGLGVVTTIGSPGADTNIPTEQAVREAISIAGGGDVSGPASSTDSNVAMFNGTTGKLLKDSGVSLSGSNTGDETAETIKTKLGITTLSGSNTGDQDLSGLVTKATYNAHTILQATTDDTPVALEIKEQTIVGRKTGGNIAALSASEVRTLINVADGATANTKATGAEVDTGSDNTKYVTAKAMKDSAYLSSMSDVTAASDTAAGKVELATAAETTTGRDDTMAVTPDGLAGSDYGKRVMMIPVIDNATTLTTGDGKWIFPIPVEINGRNLVQAEAYVDTVSSSGTPTIQIRNVTDSADMLSTRITIDASEFTSYTADTRSAVDRTKDDVATGDRIAIDVDVAGTGTKGLQVILTFQLP